MTNPSPRGSVCRSGRQHGAQGSCEHLARKDLWSQVGSRADDVLSPAGQSLWWLMQRETRVACSSPLGCGARRSQQWSGACLSYTWEVVDSTLLGLDIPEGKWRICPEACLWVCSRCRPGCSDHICRYPSCVSLPDVSPLT